jgi:hypothetical protein
MRPAVSTDPDHLVSPPDSNLEPNVMVTDEPTWLMVIRRLMRLRDARSMSPAHSPPVTAVSVEIPLQLPETSGVTAVSLGPVGFAPEQALEARDTLQINKNHAARTFVRLVDVTCGCALLGGPTAL